MEEQKKNFKFFFIVLIIDQHFCVLYLIFFEFNSFLPTLFKSPKKKKKKKKIETRIFFSNFINKFVICVLLQNLLKIVILVNSLVK